jgi:hypothetical protein
MVMADRYVEDIRNGRRFRGPSPANGFSEDSSDEEERGKRYRRQNEFPYF